MTKEEAGALIEFVLIVIACVLFMRYTK